MSLPVRRLHVRALAALAAPLVTVTALAAVPTAARADTSPTTASFDYDAAAPTQTFTVPAGVTSVTISANGGSGASKKSYTGRPDPAGGAGGTASGTFTVTPGAALSVLVAGDGGSDDSCIQTYDLACGGTGYGKGGDSYNGAGGGGASAVVTAGGTALVVAGGGGGAGSDSGGCGFLVDVPGGPGGAAGQPGSAGSSCRVGYVGGAGGGAATGTAAGAGGVSQDPNGNDSNCGIVHDGSPGSGHDGGGSGSAQNAGAGGGGWYGGGQGADGCNGTSSGGGGGGSDHVDATATNPSTGASTRSYGQNGHVTITYTPAPSPAPSTCKPGAPTIGQATAGRRGAPRTATVRWTVPASSCATPTNGYRITGQKFRNGRQVLTRTFTAPASARQLRMTFRHSAHARWRFHVAATNANGTGKASAYSIKVQPR